MTLSNIGRTPSEERAAPSGPRDGLHLDSAHITRTIELFSTALQNLWCAMYYARLDGLPWTEADLHAAIRNLERLQKQLRDAMETFRVG